MKRATLLLAVLGTILVVVAWYFLVMSPKAEELAAVELEIEGVQGEQTTTQTRITALQGVRERAPQMQAELAASESLLPRETALPSALRQLQQAADASGATLMSVSPSRPTAVEGADPTLYQMQLTLELRGRYFQMVDVLRRLEDPAISARGISWSSATLNIGDAAPELVVSLTGRMFAVLPAPPAPEADTPPTEGEEGAEEDAVDDPSTDGETDDDGEVAP